MNFERNGIDRRFTVVLRDEINLRRIRCPRKSAYPEVRFRRWGELRLLSRPPVVQHQPEAVALVSRTLLGAIGDVLAIGRIERRRVAGGIVGGDVLGRSSIHRDDPEIVVGGRGFDLIVVRGVANLLPVGREGVVVLSAEREYGSVVVSGREVAGNS